MKVLDPRHKHLTSWEVYARLEEIRLERKLDTQSKALDNLDTIVLETQSYLRLRPTANPASPQTPDRIAQFMRELDSAGIELEKVEKLQLVEIAPSSQPVLFNVIEECDQRFSEDQMELMLELVEKYLGQEPMEAVE